MNKIFLALSIFFSSLDGHEVDLDLVEPDVFDELAPKGIKYTDIQKSEKIANLTFLHQIDQILNKIESYLINIKLSSYYIGEHTFWEFDWRIYSSSQSALLMGFYHMSMGLKLISYDKATFMASFPNPPIINPFPEVVDNCESSAFKCLEYVGEITLINRGQSQHKKDNFKLKDLINTFEDNWQLFNFRATASYYLCWYTLRRNPLFRKFHSNFCPATDTQISEDFKCAELSFCPDPCCGKLFPKMKKELKFTWQRYSQECLSSDLNPCFKIGNGSCKFSEHENNNFEDLKLNKLNVTCGCPVGYVYSNEHKICIDVDECLLSSHNCKTSQNEACLNLPGTFKCICARGYIPNNRFNSTSHNFKCISDSSMIFE